MDPYTGHNVPNLASSASPEARSAPPRPTLLPAFEPLSSSPLPRVSKRKLDDARDESRDGPKLYPTPVPTSSTGILPSSSPRRGGADGRPPMSRTVSTLTERNPLCAVPTVDVPSSGEPLLMGRSSNSSHYRLPANRHISRVHVSAEYHAPESANASGEIVIACLGWNGAKVHSHGQCYELSKGDKFSSRDRSEDIMVDVNDARVMISWPAAERKGSLSSQSESSWNGEPSPSRRLLGAAHDGFASSPPPVVLGSPDSPSPAIAQPDFGASATFVDETMNMMNPNPVQIYEDTDSDDEAANTAENKDVKGTKASPSGSKKSADENKVSPVSSLSSLSDDFSENDEENDPIIPSFGSMGDNLLPRVAGISTSSPQQSRRRMPLKTTSTSPPQRASTDSTRKLEDSPIRNHVVNQLAFSRLHSMPLSTIFNNLPADMKAAKANPGSNVDGQDGEASSNKDQSAGAGLHKLSHVDLQAILHDIACVGEIPRQGKDAAGKPLENEFYYIPELDADHVRRDAVGGGVGSSGIRSVRKSHKQYYWKRPRH